jgi:hypothetical protein
VAPFAAKSNMIWILKGVSSKKARLVFDRDRVRTHFRDNAPDDYILYAFHQTDDLVLETSHGRGLFRSMLMRWYM